jgi:hypothetical protein
MVYQRHRDERASDAQWWRDRAEKSQRHRQYFLDMAAAEELPTVGERTAACITAAYRQMEREAAAERDEAER